MNLTEDQWADIESTVSYAGYAAWRPYKDYLTLADARQEANRWVLEHPQQVGRFLDDGERGLKRLRGRIIGHVHRVGRAERASRRGYRPEDEQFYSWSTLELVLPALWDESYKPWRPEDEAGRVKTSKGPVGDWDAMVADVRRAWHQADLTLEERTVASMRFGDGATLEVISRVNNLSKTTVKNRIEAVLRVLQDGLGGVEPKGCPAGCECGGPGSRRLVSVAAVQAAAEQSYQEA